jgi:hypothetical protein
VSISSPHQILLVLDRFSWAVHRQKLLRWRTVRGQRVTLDSTLAGLYGVTTRRLNEQVRRNRQRFPDDFLIELDGAELADLMSHFATSSWGGRRKPPLAFTEHGAIMAASILSSRRAVQLSVYGRRTGHNL